MDSAKIEAARKSWDDFWAKKFPDASDEDIDWVNKITDSRKAIADCLPTDRYLDLVVEQTRSIAERLSSAADKLEEKRDS